METDQLAALAGKWQNTAQCTLQALAIYGYLTWVVGWIEGVAVPRSTFASEYILASTMAALRA